MGKLSASVVLATYNGEKYLIELLDSLRLQSRQADEVIIVDDASTDQTVSIITDYILKYNLDTWKLKSNSSNLGWEENFKVALSLAKGDIIYPCDQDDIWHEDKIFEMNSEFEKNSAIELLVSDFHAFCEDGGHLETNYPLKTVDDQKTSRLIFDEHFYTILRPGCVMALKKNIIEDFLKLWNKGDPHDAILWQIASLNKSLYYKKGCYIEFRRHAENASSNITHDFLRKINEIKMIYRINMWYLSKDIQNEIVKGIAANCNIWCEYRYKLIAEKKLRYWIRLFKYRKYYLSVRKYFGDLYYYFCKE